VDDPEEHLGGLFEDAGRLLTELAHPRAGEADQHGDDQHLQQVAVGEGPEEGVGDQVQQILDQALAVLGLVDVGGGDGRIEGRGIDVEAGPAGWCARRSGR
jgi:hypothetical protein